MLHSPAAPDIPIKVDGFKKQSKTKGATEGSQRLPFLDLIDSSAQYSRRGRLSAAPALACVTLTSLDVDIHPGRWRQRPRDIIDV